MFTRKGKHCKLLIFSIQIKSIFYSSKEITVFHCTSSTCNPFRWEGVEGKINSYLHKYPLKSAVWYPHLKFVRSLFLFKLSAIFVHFIPAFFLDTITRLAGGKPILVKLHTNVWTSLKLLELFIFTEWKFHNTNTQALIAVMSPADKLKYNIDLTDLVWEDYFVSLTQGVRRYLSKEHPKSLPAARGKDTLYVKHAVRVFCENSLFEFTIPTQISQVFFFKYSIILTLLVLHRLMVLHLLLQALIYGGIWWATSSLLGMSWTKTGMIVPISYLAFGCL